MTRSLTGLALALSCLTSPLSAQENFWGMTSTGGQSNAGTIYTISTTGVFTKKYDFALNEGNTMRSELTKATDGYYYGVTFGGGYSGVGTLFRYDPATAAYTVLHHMSPTTGSNPDKGVMQASDGKLYGVCRFGGANSKGSLWRYDLTTNTFTDVVDFSGSANGQQPRGKLVQVGALLYGVTQEGGTGGLGTIYEFNPTTNVLTKRVNMAAANGTNPASGLVANTIGTQLMGTTTTGGANGLGVAYTYNTTTFSMLKRVDFGGAVNGSSPYAELVQAGNFMIGTTNTGGAFGYGTIFALDLTATFAFTKRYDLSVSTGNTVYGKMVLSSSNGLLYGVTNKGGTSDKGVVFSFDPATNIQVVRYNLNNGNAANPYAALMEDGAGQFFGTFSAAGTYGLGGIFRYQIAGNTYTELMALGASSGAYPDGSLLRASTGLYYGVTTGGGTNAAGVIFSFDPNTLTYTRLANFSSTLGSNPLGKLVLVGQVIYGVCRFGGTNSQGTLFSYNIATNTLSKLVDLQLSTGAKPQSGMLLAANGSLYGTTTEGGTASYGTLYRWDPATSTYSVVFNFPAGDGSVPVAEMIQVPDGRLFGTLGGNSSLGSVFSYDLGTNSFLQPVVFDGTNGSAPCGSLLETSPGKIYGITREGGVNGNGAVFSYSYTTNTFVLEHEMTVAEGSSAEGGLVLGTDARLYGTCSEGGGSGLGSLFQFDPAGQTLTNLRSLGYVDGVTPLDGLIKETTPGSPLLQVNAKVFLEGPYVSGTGLMNDALRSQAAFPLTEPFTALGFTNVVTGTINASVLSASGNNAIVDWILVELRNKTNSSTIITAVPALLQRDGDVVALDGTGTLTINQPVDNYFVAIRHRNHLGVMALTSVALSSSPTSLDFTTGSLATYGTAAQKQVGTAWTSWAGNVVRDTQLKYTGASNDRDPILTAIGGSLPTSTITGYRSEDCNLDGSVKYTGSGNDRDIILVNIGGSLPTNTRTQQLP